MSLPRTRGWRYLLFFLVAIATLYFLYRVREVLYAFFFGALIAYLLYRPVETLQRNGLRRGPSILLIYALAALGLGVFSYWIVPPTLSEVKEVSNLYPQYVEGAERLLGQINGIPKPERMQLLIEGNLNRIESSVYNALQAFINSVYQFMGRILALFLAPFLAFYILNDWARIKSGCLGLLSPVARVEFQGLCQQIDSILEQFVTGYLIVAGLVGLLTGLLALALGVPFPLLVGILAGFSNLVPYFGPLLGGIPIVALAGGVSLRSALYMAVGIIIVQQLDANLFTPRIIGPRLGMHPLLIIFAILAGGSLFGLWGLLLGVPAAAILKVLLHWAHLKIAA